MNVSRQTAIAIALQFASESARWLISVPGDGTEISGIDLGRPEASRRRLARWRY
jgi:hypothetical protein